MTKNIYFSNFALLQSIECACQKPASRPSVPVRPPVQPEPKPEPKPAPPQIEAPIYVAPPSSTSVSNNEERFETEEDQSPSASVDRDSTNATLELLAKYVEERFIELILTSSFGLTSLVEVIKELNKN